jgi:hypothetical protein
VDTLRHKLDASMPQGLDIVDAVLATDGDLVARLQASIWQFVLPEISLEQLDEAVSQYLAADVVEVDRMTKGGLRRFDARGPVLTTETRLSPGQPSPCAILTVVVRHGTPSVRPDDVLAALRQVADLVPPVPPQVTRLAQGPLAADARTVTDPLAPDRAGSNRLSREPEAAVGR